LSDKKNIIPIVISVVLHLALVVVLVWQFIWKPNIPEHKYVDAPIQARIATAPKSNPPPQETSKPKVDEQKEKQKKLEQERLEKQKREAERQKKIQREKKEAEQEAKEKAAEEKAAKEKAEQERKKTLALEKKKKEEEAEKKRLEEEKRKKAEAEKKRKAEAEKKRLAEEKRKKEEAEKKRLAEEKRKKEELERLQKELAAEDSEFFDAQESDVKRAQALTEIEKISALIESKIVRLWNKPNEPGLCEVKIKTAPGGVVLETIVIKGDDHYCQTGIAAINRASPLPYSENPDVIKALRSITFTFDPSKKD